MNKAVAAAKAAFREWSATPVSVRTQILFGFKALAEQHLDELATLLATEKGKCMGEARGAVLKGSRGPKSPVLRLR